jgi:hypothetical protein
MERLRITKEIRGCIQKFPYWPPGARTANGTGLCHRRSCIAILWVSLVSFIAIILCVVSQRLILRVNLYFVIDSVRKLLDTPSYLRLDSCPLGRDSKSRSCEQDAGPRNCTWYLRISGKECHKKRNPRVARTWLPYSCTEVEWPGACATQVAPTARPPGACS